MHNIRDMHNINPIIKKLVNKHYNCMNCDQRHYCYFGDGENPPYDCNEDCLADETADGMQIAFNYLAEIPRNEAMKEIIKVIKS